LIHVSVIVCCYNDGRFLARALESLRQQTLPSDQFELILVNDGSSDDTERVALSFDKKLNLKYIKNDTNRGLPASCNVGLERATGEYFIRIDADDLFDPSILEKMSVALRSGRTDLVYSDRFESVAATGEKRYVSMAEFNVFKLTAIGTMLRTNRIVAIGGYRNLFWEEYDLYMRYLTPERKVFHIPEALFTHTLRAGSMTTHLERVKQGWAELKELWPAEVLRTFGAHDEH